MHTPRNFGLRHPGFATATLAVSILLTGCASEGVSEQPLQPRVYFSHAGNNTPATDLFRQLEVSEDAAKKQVQSAEELVLYFDNDSSKLRAEDIERLQSFVLNFSAERYPLFLITGHTDSNHTDLYNHALSDRRALATRSEMLKMGVPAERTALQGLGESQPIASNENATGRQTNRRVTVSVLSPNMTKREENQAE